MPAMPEIPEAIVHRYVVALQALVTTARAAVSTGSTPQAKPWREKMLPMLEGRLAAVEDAAAHFAIGHQQPLLEAALPLRFLARDMDGYSLEFAGEPFATQLKERQRLVVLAAWQLCHAAGAA